MWETFTLTDIADDRIYITAVEGPTLVNFPDYPALRVADLQVVGEVIETPGYFNVRERNPPFRSPPGDD